METFLYFCLGALFIAVCTMGVSFAVAYFLTWGDKEKSLAFAEVSTRLVAFLMIFSLLTGGL